MKRSSHPVVRFVGALLLGLQALAAFLPSAAHAEEAPEELLEASAAPAGEIVAEALFLCDPLPPVGRDLGLAVLMVPGRPDPLTGEPSYLAQPRLQLAVALGERAGLTVDVGLGGEGQVIQAPAASFKALLRTPGADRIGLSASLDLFGSTRSLAETEAGLGVGAIRQLGPVGLRASAALASSLSSWSPHLHAGASAAMALGPRWRGLLEVITEVGSRGLAVAAGPTLKVALSEGSALVVGALLPLARSGPPPVLAFQVVQSI
jgi:hypothetical protein